MSVYLLSLFLMVVYAWNRFNTPATARSSTRQTLYWASCSGYVACMLGLFVILSFALELDAVRAALLGKGADGGKVAGNAPSVLLAMLVLTAMLPSLPLFKQADAWLLDLFHEMGSIPAEVSRRAAQLTPGAFQVSTQDVAALARFIEQSELPDGLVGHLRGNEPDGLERSQFRFTRVAKLYMRLSVLRASPRYAKFFSGAQAEWGTLATSFGTFARRSDAVLTLAEKLRDAEGRSVYEELVSEKRESYRLECLACFQPLAQFLARAVLRSEGGEREVVRALRDIGFDATPVTEPEFPVQSLAGLVLLMLALFLVVSGPLSSLIPPPRPAGVAPPNMMIVSFVIVFAHCATVALTVWLMQRFPFFRRSPGAAPSFLAYAVCALIGSAVAAAVCALFILGQHGELPRNLDSYPFVVPIVGLSGMLCLAVAFLCDTWPPDRPAPARRRLLEAAGCCAAMAFAAWIIAAGTHATDAVPTQDRTAAFAVMLGLPGTVGLMMGLLVPHIYRGAFLAARARSSGTAPASEATHLLAPAQ